jgi:hypothetical protein
MPERQGQGRSDAVRIGVLLPSRETAMTGEHDGPGLIAFAGDAEAAGFDSVWTGDSPLARTRMDPMSLLAAAAAVTKRVGLGTAASRSHRLDEMAVLWRELWSAPVPAGDFAGEHQETGVRAGPLPAARPGGCPL